MNPLQTQTSVLSPELMCSSAAGHWFNVCADITGPSVLLSVLIYVLLSVLVCLCWCLCWCVCVCVCTNVDLGMTLANRRVELRIRSRRTALMSGDTAACVTPSHLRITWIRSQIHFSFAQFVMPCMQNPTRLTWGKAVVLPHEFTSWELGS